MFCLIDEHFIVLYVDENPEVQALKGSTPLLPLGTHIPARQSADYYRHSTTTILVTLDMLTENVQGIINKPHKSADFIAFKKT